jgi:aminopeptidase N
MAVSSTGWTLDTLQEHFRALDAANEKFMQERDRRYSEVNIEREKALKIKEEADKAALGLAREIQSYKDEKANQLREQITGERGSFASKDDLAAAIREVSASIAPLTAYVQGVGGANRQTASSITMIVAGATVVNVIIVGLGLLIAFMSMRGR